MRRTIAVGAALAIGLAAIPVAVRYWPQDPVRGMSVGVAMLPSLGTLTPADADLVARNIQIRRSPAGTRLTAIKADGERVWAAFNADVYVGPDTATIKSHDLIVALIAFPAPISDDTASLDLPAGTTPPMIRGRSYVIDSTNGRIVEEASLVTLTPNGHNPLPTVLGTPTDLTNYAR